MNAPLQLVLHQRATDAPEIHIVLDQDGLYRVEKWKHVTPLSFGVPFSPASKDLRKRRFRTIEELQSAVMDEIHRT